MKFKTTKQKNYKEQMEQKQHGEKVNTNSIKQKIRQAEEYKNKIEITTNRVYINNEFQQADEANIIFVRQNDNISYINSYKKSGEQAPKSFNSGLASKRISLPIGKYEVYVEINKKYYDTKLIVEF